MSEVIHNAVHRGAWRLTLSVLVALLISAASLVYGQNKDGGKAVPAQGDSGVRVLDIRKIVWPQPPNIARVKYVSFFAGEKLPDFKNAKKKKSGWMDRVAGVQADDGGVGAAMNNHFFLGEPHGLAVDAAGKKVYVSDGKVGAIFIFDIETHDTEMIKNGKQANFGLIMGLALDDTDRLFVADSGAHRVLVFNSKHRPEASITQGLVEPIGLAIDNENRYLYVADIGADQIVVYDADTFELLRRIGTGGKNHTLTSPGDFAKPTGVAVDKDGNLYVADMLNARIEIFDADGNFVRTFGKRGDGPGYFAMPKGVAVDCDGHIWVTDPMQNRVQVLSPEGKLLLYMGNGRGILPGMFSGVQYVTIDKSNRVFTSEVYPGRVQEFRYVTQAEAQVEFANREAEKSKRATVSSRSAMPPKSTTAAESKAAPNKDSAAK